MTADPVLLYDGDCGFCTSAVRAAERLLGTAGWRSVPFQRADLRRLAEFTEGWATPERARREVLWITPDGRVYGGAQAVARALMRARGAWAYAGAVLTLPALRQAAAGVYHLVSVYRHRLPGGTPACAARER